MYAHTAVHEITLQNEGNDPVPSSHVLESNNLPRILVAFNTPWNILNHVGLLWPFRPTSPNIIQLSCGHNNEWMILIPREWIDYFIYLNYLLEESSSRKSEVNLLDQLPAFQGKNKIEMYQSPKPFAPSDGMQEIFARGIRRTQKMFFLWNLGINLKESRYH